jgi:hypothetical protein
MSDEKKPEARLTREDAEVLIASPGLWGRSEQGPMAYALLAHFDATEAAIAAQRKEIERLRKAAVALYYAAYWHADRPVDEAALWMALRDAAEIPPGHTASVLGPDRSGETVERLAGALRRIRAWDHMDTAADGAFWRAEIDKLLEEVGE